MMLEVSNLGQYSFIGGHGGSLVTQMGHRHTAVLQVHVDGLFSGDTMPWEIFHMAVGTTSTCSDVVLASSCTSSALIASHLTKQHTDWCTQPHSEHSP